MNLNCNFQSHIETVVDFDIHGIVGIRLINPTASDEKALAHQLGLPKTTLNREPDIVICFQEKLPMLGLKYQGLDRTGFTDEGFYVLVSSHKKVKVRIPFEQIGGRCEIVCENGINAIPLLYHIINFTFLSKNYLPLHSAAFVYENTGILVTGWATGGKTEALLAFANQGAKYVGDEWVILSPDSNEMFALPTPTSIKKWQFPYIPELLAGTNISTAKRLLISGIHILEDIYNALSWAKLKNVFPVNMLGEALPLLKKQQKIWVSPPKFFKDQFHEGRAPLDKVFLIGMHDQTNVEVETCNPVEVAARMISSNHYEWQHFFE